MLRIKADAVAGKFRVEFAVDTKLNKAGDPVYTGVGSEDIARALAVEYHARMGSGTTDALSVVKV